MKSLKIKGISIIMALSFFVVIAAVVGFFKGSEAKQKWVFKIKDKNDNKRQVAEKRSIVRKGGVLLDDIELAAYHS